MSWEQTRARARRLAEQVSARRGEPLWLRDYPAAAEGDVGWVVLGVAREGVHRACALVGDLGALQSLVVEVREEREVSEGRAGAERAAAPPHRGRQLRSFRNSDDGLHQAIVVLDAELAVPEEAPGLLDASFAVLDALGQTLAVPQGRWRLETWGHDQPGSGASISLVGGPHAWPHLVTLTAPGSGVQASVPGAAMAAGEQRFAVPTVAALVAALPAVVAQARAAVDGRAGFRARPLSAATIAAELVEAMRSAQVASQLVVEGGDDAGFPHRWPRARVLERADGLHLLVTIEEGPADRAGAADPSRAAVPASAFSISIDGVVARCHDPASFRALLPELLERARRAAARLTPGRLGVDQLYEVIEPFRGLTRGARLRFAGRDGDPRGEIIQYTFHALGEGARLVLIEGGDDDVLGALERYLVRVSAEQSALGAPAG